MLGYVKKVLQRYRYKMPRRPQRSPYLVAQIKYGQESQDPIPEDTTRSSSKEEVLKVQHVVGSILYYAQVVDLTALMSLATIEIEQAKATGHTIDTLEKLLDYIASSPDATIRFEHLI